MKYFYLFLLASLTIGCNRVGYIEFTGIMPGIKNGIFMIKNLEGQPKFEGDITDGKLYLKKILDTSGYYNMYITADESNDKEHSKYEVYLEKGNYTIETEAGKLDRYPVIRSSSKTQNEISAFYALAGGKMDDEAKAAALGNYVNKYPQNDIAAHIMSQIDYTSDAVNNYRVYQKFTEEEKNSDDGKIEGNALALLAKLAPGAQAPPLLGNTPDGRPFNSKTLNKRVILLEFWRSDNEASRINHQKLHNDYYSPLKIKDLAAVSFSLDTKQDVWENAIKKDKLEWQQISDLKGEDSPNVKSWAVDKIPTYDLLDGNWHIIKRDVEFKNLPMEIAGYLGKALNQ